MRILLMGAWDVPEGEYKTRPYTVLMMTVQPA